MAERFGLYEIHEELGTGGIAVVHLAKSPAIKSPVAIKRLLPQVAKVRELVGSFIDEARLANEVALFADRVDVTEEIVRLASHVKQMRALLGEDTAVGRRLDFLTQELGREVNTIGSKSQSAEIAARVVGAKAEVEKIREQVQNVE